jgi:hypothetical protein
MRTVLALALATISSTAIADTQGWVGVSPSTAARNYANHSAPVPGVRLSPARVTSHSDGSYSASRTASGPFGQRLTSNASFRPSGGGTSFSERTSGSNFARAIHGAVYNSSNTARVLGGRR